MILMLVSVDISTCCTRISWTMFTLVPVTDKGPCHLQAQQMQEEAGRLSQEKAALLTTVQSLKADNDRLRAFKRKLLHSLQNDSEVVGPAQIFLSMYAGLCNHKSATSSSTGHPSKSSSPLCSKLHGCFMVYRGKKQVLHCMLAFSQTRPSLCSLLYSAPMLL